MHISVTHHCALWNTCPLRKCFSILKLFSQCSCAALYPEGSTAPAVFSGDAHRPFNGSFLSPLKTPAQMKVRTSPTPLQVLSNHHLLPDLIKDFSTQLTVFLSSSMHAIVPSQASVNSLICLCLGLFVPIIFFCLPQLSLLPLPRPCFSFTRLLTLVHSRHYPPS